VKGSSSSGTLTRCRNAYNGDDAGNPERPADWRMREAKDHREDDAADVATRTYDAAHEAVRVYDEEHKIPQK
jgi:hypothetical protein